MMFNCGKHRYKVTIYVVVDRHFGRYIKQYRSRSPKSVHEHLTIRRSEDIFDHRNYGELSPGIFHQS
jgi:hypothetical protein